MVFVQVVNERHADDSALHCTRQSARILTRLNKRLAAYVPADLTLSAYLVLKGLLMTTSRKADCRRLRKIGRSWHSSRLWRSVLVVTEAINPVQLQSGNCEAPGLKYLVSRHQTPSKQIRMPEHCVQTLQSLISLCFQVHLGVGCETVVPLCFK